MSNLKGQKTNLKKSSVSRTGVITGGIAVCMTIFNAVNSNSLALWADFSVTLMDFFAVFVAWRSFRKIESGPNEKFNYGYGKFESLASLSMSVLMAISFICIMTVAVVRFRNPVQVGGVGVLVAIIAHSIYGVINGGLFFKSLQLEREESSSLSSAQRRLYLIKFGGNIVILSALVLTYFFQKFSWTRYADPIAATFIALLILANATKIFRYTTRDLLDYALEEPHQLLILRSLAHHFHNYENIEDIRTRVSGGKIYVEIFLVFDGNLLHADIMKTSQSMQKEIMDLLKCDEVLIIPVAEK